jgi:hypothetical protein
MLTPRIRKAACSVSLEDDDLINRFPDYIYLYAC